jgi:hypothetical protein
MRRPALHRPTPHTAGAGWAHPYATGIWSAVFYNGAPAAPPAAPPAPAVPPVPPVADPPKPGPPPSAPKMFTQEEVTALAASEKAQGRRAAAKEFAEKHGFSSVEDAEAFIEAARQAQQAQLTEEQRRKQELDDREAKLATLEAQAVARERTANRRAVLVGLGSTGADLEDATALLRVDDDADDATVTAAAEALKARRPELFGVTAPAAVPGTPPAPGGAPAGGPPPRSTPAGKPGDRGRAMAASRGHKPAA